jgi:hypothetical protein
MFLAPGTIAQAGGTSAVPRSRQAGPGAPRQRRIQRSGQAGAVGNLPQQHHARVADQVLAVGPHGTADAPSRSSSPAGCLFLAVFLI